MTVRPTQTNKQSRRATPTLVVVCGAVFFSVLNGTMVNVALPVIGDALSVEPARLGWIVTGYLLVYGVSVPFYGKLADVYGGRRLFVLGLTIFSAASLLCALSLNYPMLLVARVAQAIGASAIPGLGMALISQQFPPERRGSAMGLVSATVGFGSAVGPTLGGFLAGTLNWHYLFFFSALSGLLIPPALRTLSAGERKGAEGLDLPGGILLALSIGGALLAATEGSRGNWLAPQVVAAIGISVVAAVALSLRYRLASEPFIPRDLVRNRRFLALVGISFLTMAASAGTFLTLPLLLSQVNKLSPTHVGLALLPNALALVLFGPVVGRLSDRIGGGLLVRLGLLIMLASQVLFSTLGAGASIPVVVALFALHGAGFAFINSPIAMMVSLVIPNVRVSTGLSINSMCFFLGAGFGTALVAAALTVRRGAETALNPLYSGKALAFSDTFLIAMLPLLAALLLSPALPGKLRHVVAPRPAPAPRSVGSAARE